jgi:hypothetical protein
VVIVGVDVGIRTLGICRLRLPPGSAEMLSLCGEGCPLALRMCKLITVESWRVDQILPPSLNARMCPSASVLDGLVKYMETEGSIFGGADVVVIESQMTARMKMLSAAIYVMAKAAAPQARVNFQSAVRKLGFADFSQIVHGIEKRTYTQRKKAAVSITRELISHLEIGDAERSKNAEAHDAFSASRKQDDLADSFLHALSALADRV